ncbi:hypothetical protein SALBM311S_10428 [Streptomyces alboniger]
MTAALQRIQSLPSWLVGRVAARARGLVADALAAEGLKLMHHAVLAATAEYGPVAQAELGRRLAVDPKDMVGILNDLQHAGTRPAHPGPGRSPQERHHGHPRRRSRPHPLRGPGRSSQRRAAGTAHSGRAETADDPANPHP